jgi:folate-binding protein YgfZ
MISWEEVRNRFVGDGGAVQTMGRRTVAVHYGAPAAEYAAIDAVGGVCDRADRATFQITGADRASWLHNLTTNQITQLVPGQGCYAFALNVKGRILFDLNVLVDEDRIWVDLDDRFVETALSHFAKYTVAEDVRISDGSETFARLAVVGSGGVAALGAILDDNSLRGPRASASADRSSEVSPTLLTMYPCRFGDSSLLVFVNCFCGMEAAEIIVPADTAALLWDRLARTDTGTLAPVGRRALDTLRIEAGIPWSVSELNDEVVPAETMQLARAVSFTKGCYLGQEVVERMRAHGSLARKLVGLEFATGVTVSPPSPIEAEGKTVGTLTSFCHSPKVGRPIGLGYARVVHSRPGTVVTVGRASATIRAWPFQRLTEEQSSGWSAG